MGLRIERASDDDPVIDDETAAPRPTRTDSDMAHTHGRLTDGGVRHACMAMRTRLLILERVLMCTDDAGRARAGERDQISRALWVSQWQ